MAAFLLSFVVSLVLTWVARWTGRKLDIVDQSFGRKIHKGSIPRLGGTAVSLAFFFPVYGILLWNNDVADIWRSQAAAAVALFIGGLSSMLMGLWDDVWSLRARYKLFFQIGIAIFTYMMGVRIDAMHLPFIGTLEMGAFALPVTVAWILAFMNAINLIDGVDGLCGGVVFIASITTFIIARTTGSVLTGLFAAALAGAVLGFLRYNFNPATIFLGDSGSYFLGYVLATVSIIGARKTSVAVAVMAPILAAGLPLLDTLLAITRRWLHGRPIFAPDRGHIHHLLLDRGYSARRVALVMYGLQLALAVGGLAIVFGQSWELGLAIITTSIVIFYLVRLTGVWRVPRLTGARGLDHGPPLPILPEMKSDQLVKVLPEALERIYGLNLGQNSRLNDAVNRFCADCELEEMEVWLDRTRRSEPNLRWTTDKPVNKRTTVVKATYPLTFDGQRFGMWKIAWRAELPKLTSDTDVLLRLYADAMARAMVRVDPGVLGADGGDGSATAEAGTRTLSGEYAHAAKPHTA